MLLTYRKCQHTDFDIDIRLALYISSLGCMYLVYIFCSAGSAARAAGLVFDKRSAFFSCDDTGGKRCQAPAGGHSCFAAA